MANKKRKGKEDKVYTDEQLTAVPTTPLLMEIYMEDKYKVILNPEGGKELKEKVKENNWYCPLQKLKCPANRCMCDDFKNRDSEGPCSCGVYVKQLRSDEEFKKMRAASLNRGNK